MARSILNYQPPGRRRSLFDAGQPEPDLGDERLRFLTWIANSSALLLTEHTAREPRRRKAAGDALAVSDLTHLGTRGKPV